MRKGVYSTANLKRIRMVPFAYRCSACGAFNDGFYPADASAAAGDSAEESLTANGRELTEAEHLSRTQRELRLIAGRLQKEIAGRKWNGSPNGIALCGACGHKAVWSRQSMRASDWIMTLLVPFGIGVYELAYEGFYCHEPRAILYGILLLALSVVLMVSVAFMMSARKRRIYRLPPESLPAFYGSPEALEEALRSQRKNHEPIYRSIDPRSPDAAFLAEQNEAARTETPPEPLVLCKWCLRTLNAESTRYYGNKQYCPECYGIVRQEAETRSYLKSHRKRGGEIM